MKIRSDAADESYVIPQITEHVFLTVLVAAGVPMALFVFFSRSMDTVMKLVLDEPVQAGAVLIAMVVLVNLVLLVSRRMQLIVEMELLDDRMRFVVRGITKRSARIVEVPMAELSWARYSTQAMRPIPNYKGYRFYSSGAPVGDVFTDHFTWEQNTRALKLFLERLNSLNPVQPLSERSPEPAG